MNRLGIKLLLTLPIVALLVWPFYDLRVQGGVFHDLQVLGPVGFALTALGFFALVYFYCRDLSRVVQLVSPAARAATPRSIWLMLLLPLNFVEDFFIIVHVSQSLLAESQHNPRLAQLPSVGLHAGLAWCSLQILSLLPHWTGSLFGLIALPFWIHHWRVIRRAIHALQP